MPNTREKLIELLETVVSPNEVHCDGEVLVSTSRVADHLIANGVTVQEWISVKDRLPREEWEHFTEENDWDVYPCLTVVKTSRGGRYVTKMFYTGKNFENDEYVRYTAQVTHWMPLPPCPEDAK